MLKDEGERPRLLDRDRTVLAGTGQLAEGYTGSWKKLWMKQVGQDLEAIHQAGTRPAEIGHPIYRVHPT